MNAAQATEKADTTRGVARWLIQITILILIHAAALFIAAGRLDWVWGWVYVGVFVFSQAAVAVALIPTNPELLADRAGSKGPRDLDRVLAGVMALYGPLATLIVAGLDQRFGWSPQMALALQIGAVAMALLAALLGAWAMAANRHFYGVLCIEKEQDHTVATTGPYQVLRHPGYLAGALFDLATPFLLGSLWALIPAVLTVIAIVARTSLEDRALQAELDGYADYAGRVRYRLLPGVW